MRLRFLPTAAFFIVSIVGGTLAAQSKRPITETDLFQFTWIGDPQVSPDGSRVVFVRVNVNAKKDGYDSALFVAATSGDEQPRRLTAGATRLLATVVARRQQPRVRPRARTRR
jgi:dipeptidyl aminopeptidase/acylaminoacyl peptidase